MIISHKYRFIFIKSAKVAGTSVEMFLSSVGGPSDVCTPFWHEEEGHEARNYKGLFDPFAELRFRAKMGQPYQQSGFSRTVSDFFALRKFFEPMPAWQVRARIPRRVWRDYLKFTIERNPWEKVVSRYYHSRRVFRDKYGGDLSWRGFLDYLEEQLQKPWSTPAWSSPAPYNIPRYADPITGEVLVDKIIRYERLNEELTTLFSGLGVPFSGSLKERAKAGYREDKNPYWEELGDEERRRVERIFAAEIRLLGYRWRG